MYPIEKNVPIPQKNRHGRPSKYPWRDMEVGDSFVMQLKVNSAVNMCRHARATTGYKFSCRTQPDGTVRVWRIA